MNLLETDFLQKAFADGHLQLIQSSKTEKLRYVTNNHAERWSGPEEKVRAAYFAELIYRYGYAAECIAVEFTVPDRTPSDRADLVIFHDKEQKRWTDSTPSTLTPCNFVRCASTR